MFRAIGVVIILWYLSSLFADSFLAADAAFSASFNALQAVVMHAEKNVAF